MIEAELFPYVGAQSDDVPYPGAVLPGRLMRVSELAERWSVSSSTVLSIIRRGLLRAVQVGSRYRIEPSAVIEYEKSMQCHDVRPTPRPIASVNGPVSSMSSGGTGTRVNAFRLGQQTAKRQSAR